MRSVWIIFIGFFAIVSLMFIFKSNENEFIEESKFEIKKIDSAQNKLFSEADNIITNIMLENSKKDSIFKNLNGELNSEKNKLKYLVNKLKNYSVEVSTSNADYNNKIDSLKKKLSFVKMESNEKDVLIKSYLDSIESKNIEIKDYNNKIEEYVNDTSYTSFDTVHKTIYSIDTILIPAEKVKTLKLKKEKKEKNKLFNNLFKK